jgi:hypothetical protein
MIISDNYREDMVKADRINNPWQLIENPDINKFVKIHKYGNRPYMQRTFRTKNILITDFNKTLSGSMRFERLNESFRDLIKFEIWNSNTNERLPLFHYLTAENKKRLLALFDPQEIVAIRNNGLFDAK